MTAIYSVVADTRRDLIRIKLAGLFDDAAIAGFLSARRAAHARLRCAPNQHLTLTDTRDIAIQTQEMVGRWGSILADPVFRSRRLGFIVAPTLARAQLQRAVGGRNVRLFTDPAEAEAWVLEAGPASRAA